LKRAQRWIEASKAERLLHPVYSPDLAPSDFFLFGHIKRTLFDHKYASREGLLNAITDTFTGIDQEVLLSVFKSWGNWFKW
jgi:hypothetical protein